MGQNFIGCDREQELLLPPSLRDWLPADHLAWFVLDAVEAIDLDAFYAAYRSDGWGRAAFEPSMMVGLTVYAYCVGERASRAIERRCREDVAFRVICGNLVPDHATIARFRVRHDEAIADLFDEVLALCARAGVVSVGTVAVDGTKIHANASRSQNRTYREIAREMLDEAAEADAADDARFGDRRGDELPDEMASVETRRARLAELKRELDAEREQRAADAEPTREARLHEAKLRLEEDWRAEHQVNAEWRAWWLRRRDELALDGKKMRGIPPKFLPAPPPEPAGKINITDPDSEMVKSLHGWLQGYTAQAVATEQQIIVAADVIKSGNERARLEPMIDQALSQLERAGIDDQPRVVLADAGYFQHRPDRTPAPARHPAVGQPRRFRSQLAWHHAAQAVLRRDARRDRQRRRPRALQAPLADHRAGLCADQDDPRHGPLPTKRPQSLPDRMAPDRRHPQPPQALAAHHTPATGLTAAGG